MDDLEYSTLEERNNSEGDNNKETKLWMIICTLPGHEMAGMTATLTVAP